MLKLYLGVIFLVFEIVIDRKANKRNNKNKLNRNSLRILHL